MIAHPVDAKTRLIQTLTRSRPRFLLTRCAAFTAAVSALAILAGFYWQDPRLEFDPVLVGQVIAFRFVRKWAGNTAGLLSGLTVGGVALAVGAVMVAVEPGGASEGSFIRQPLLVVVMMLALAVPIYRSGKSTPRSRR